MLTFETNRTSPPGGSHVSGEKSYFFLVVFLVVFFVAFLAVFFAIGVSHLLSCLTNVKVGEKRVNEFLSPAQRFSQHVA